MAESGPSIRETGQHSPVGGGPSTGTSIDAGERSKPSPNILGNSGIGGGSVLGPGGFSSGGGNISASTSSDMGGSSAGIGATATAFPDSFMGRLSYTFLTWSILAGDYCAAINPWAVAVPGGAAFNLATFWTLCAFGAPGMVAGVIAGTGFISHLLLREQWRVCSAYAFSFLPACKSVLGVKWSVSGLRVS